ncbi:MAG: GNAT family N-acetyltransferase [Candidatus Poribacteria bacterium]
MTVAVEHTPGRGALPGLFVRLQRDGDEIGVCECRAHGHYLRAQDAQDRLLVEGLHVSEAERGRGFGRYLLRRALWEGHRIGHRHADLRVRTNNLSPMMLYASEGFRILATGYMLTKSLGEETGDVEDIKAWL